MNTKIFNQLEQFARVHHFATMIVITFLVLLCLHLCAILAEIHGGTFLALAGRDAVVLASDSRFSSQQTGTLLLGEFKRPVIRVGSKSLIGCFGLENDAHYLLHKIREIVSQFNDADLDPTSISTIVSNILYKSGLYCTPLIVGITEDGPYLCCMDSLGAQTVTKNFAAIGTANAGLLSICESQYVPDLEVQELQKLTQSCLRTALKRDVLSGCTMRLLTLTKDGKIYESYFDIENP